MNSLTSEAKVKLECNKEKYTITIDNADGTTTDYVAGVCLLKHLISTACIDTAANSMSIQTQMGQLYTYIQAVGSNIPEFNLHVNHLIQQLLSRGESSDDLLHNLFKAYKNATDKAFVEYIKEKESRMDDGSAEYTANELMVLAENKYKVLVERSEWEAPSEEQEQLVALRSELKDLKSQVKKAGKKTGKEKQKGTDGKQKNGNERPKWLKNNERPSKLSETRKWKNNVYYFCCKETGGKCEGNWRTHKPKKCEGKARQKRPQKKGGGSTDDNEERRLKIAKAMSARIDGEVSDQSDEE